MTKLGCLKGGNHPEKKVDDFIREHLDDPKKYRAFGRKLPQDFQTF